MPKTYILGHLKPDTDAAVAPLALAKLYQAQSCFGYNDPIPALCGPLNPETSYLFERFEQTTPEIITASTLNDTDQVILVDHNEATQRLADLPENLITEVIDHHKINLNLPQPIYVTCKPWGSTNTIIAWLMKEYDVTPDKRLAALMLAAILSDTVGYKSATTTDRDKKMGAHLAHLAEITDVDAFTLDIFKAKSDISSLSPQQIVTNDYKVFDFGQKVLVNQIETVEQEALLSDRKAELLAAMQAVKQEQGVDLLYVAVTDILKVNTKLLMNTSAEIEIAQKAFGGSVNDSVLDIGPKLSRKKEIAPALEAALQ